MSIAKITMIGFYNYLSNINDDLFKYLNVPEGIDKDTLINTILLRGGEFEVLYSDPVFFQNMIGVWSNKWQRTMSRWIEALNIEYNPLENYDRIEEWEDSGNKLSSSNTSQNEAVTRNENAIAQDVSDSTGSGNTKNTRSAFNSADYQPHDKAESSTTGSNTSSSLTSANGNTNTAGNVAANTLDNTNAIHSGRVHGNIGVTTSQQMLEAELKISKWNIYEELTNLFLNEFCIYVY